MKTTLWLFRQIVKATLATVLLSALVHLAVVFYEYMMTGDVAYINPVVFLGLQTVKPSYSQSSAATAVGWAILISIGSFIFLFRARWFIRIQVRKFHRRLHKSLFMTIYRSAIMSITESDSR